MAVVVETTLGDLTVDLFVEERPLACLNFLKLCKLKYYNFNLFHNIEHDFIAQTGDPTGAGDGGESVWGVVEGFHKRYFEAESRPKIKHTVPGLVSMVSVGKNMVGSQFFFTLGSDLISLDGVHCVIGEVVEGHEVLRKLNEAIVDDKYRPYQDVRITHTVILEDPFEDPRGFQIPSRSPSPSAERLKNGRIGADEDIDDTEGKSAQEIQEMLQEREAKARAIILEIVGDLPDAEIAPPENVLFVCKLNPVTTDDDLEIIFSRFGKVKCCEVIRDKLTGESLQYAFVEFFDKKSCENAYFKMDNVLIDDRRIHVDFSQSVAKVKWKGKGRGVVRNDGKDGGKLDFNNLRQAENSSNKNRPKNKRGGIEDERINSDRERRQPRQQSPRRNRSRSRSNESRDRNKRDNSNSRSRPTNTKERRRSGSRSKNTSSRHNEDHRDNRRLYENESRDRDRFTRSNNQDRRNDIRFNRRSRSRSPKNAEVHRYHDRSLDNHSNRQVGKEHRDYNSHQMHSSRNSREFDHHNKSRNERYRASDNRSRRADDRSKSRLTEKTQLNETRSTNRKDGKSVSSTKRKKSKKVKKKESSSSSTESDTSSTSSSSSSSSSDNAQRKRNKKKSAKKSSKKKQKKHKSSSSSDSSSDSNIN